MIDTKKIRKENNEVFCDCRRMSWVLNLCNEVDRVVKLHEEAYNLCEEAHNLYVVAQIDSQGLKRDLSHTIKAGMMKDLRIDALLDALVAKREK